MHLLFAFAGAGTLAACASPTSNPSQISPEENDWVVVMFEDRPAEFDGGLMDALLETELSADEALGAAGVGRIDGNDVGAHGYELYFIGTDAAQMWDVLEPIFASAPVSWTRVELRNGLEDSAPRVLTRD